MPYSSKAQASYFNIHKKDLEKQGVDVDEWNESSKGKDLPEHSSKKVRHPGALDRAAKKNRHFQGV